MPAESGHNHLLRGVWNQSSFGFKYVSSAGGNGHRPVDFIGQADAWHRCNRCRVSFKKDPGVFQTNTILELLKTPVTGRRSKQQVRAVVYQCCNFAGG